MPVGHTANAVFWYSDDKFSISTYYMDSLLEWVDRFNAQKLDQTLMPKGWNTLFPLESYTPSESDDKWYERSCYDNDSPVSPHQETPFRATPFANDYTFRFAEAAVEGYHLGDGKYPD